MTFYTESKHEQALAASHARGVSEDIHNERIRLMREVDEGMDKIVRPIIRGEYKEFDNESF